MAAAPAQGSCKHSRVPSAEGSPESSLTWCLAHILKPAPSGADHPGHETRGRDLDKRSRASQWKALVAIRTQHTKGDKAGIARFRTRGGLRPLLGLLQQPQCPRKTLDLALSILGNCCTELETRVEVRKLDGINVVVDVLKRSVALDTVQNRAARALGNLAMDPESSALIHSAGGVPLLLLLCMCVSSSPSSPTAAPPKDNRPKLECAQSAARALLYLADTHANRLSLVTQGAVAALAPLIAPEYPPALRRAALRTLHELTRGCDMECAREVSRSGVLAQLGVMATAESGKPFEELALKTLANMCSQGSLRPLVGSLGVIPKFSEEVKRDPLKSGVFLKALCLCCKEAVNRAKVKESGGLEALISSLSAHQSNTLSRLPIMACVDFVFDESAMEQLQELGLAPLLVARLVELSRGEDQSADKMDVHLSSSLSPAELLPSSCFNSFDFPSQEGCRKEDAGKEQASSSFQSLRSWLVSEGLISSEGDLLDSSGVEGEWGALQMSSSPQTSSPHPPGAALKNASSAKKSSHPSPQSPSPASRDPPASCPSQQGSSPLQPPAKTPVSPTKFSSPHRRRHRASSAACVTKVTLDAPPSAPRPAAYHPYHPEPWTPESPILLLLSRFSHFTDPSAALITSGVMSGLLLYLTQHQDPSSRCIRLLCRLSCNPNCLQALVRTGSVGLIQHLLCRRDGGPQGDERQADRVKAKVRQLGVALLNHLRVQCESGFGSGVVSHVMLSGSESDKVNCALCLPLLTSNKSLLKKLLLDSGGLLLALQPLGVDHDEDEDDEGHSRRLLSDLFNKPHLGLTPQRPSLYFSLLVECLAALPASVKTELGSQRWRRLRVPPHTWKELPPPSKKARPADACPYGAARFDLVLLLDDGTRIPASGEAVAGAGGAGSEYFRALLRGGFQEAQAPAQKAISIKDVSAGMLLPVLHYLHGCGLAEGGGRCQVLDSLLLDGLSLWRNSAEELRFQKTPLGEAMAGACRFLVDELQKELEDLCVSLLVSIAVTASEGRGVERTSRKADQNCSESAEENLATRTSELELTACEKTAEGSRGRANETSEEEATIIPESARPEEPAATSGGRSSARPADADSPRRSGGGGGAAAAAALSVLLPQVYRFSQRYSFPSLRRACLALLLNCRDPPRPLHPPAAAAACLRSLAREADCTDALIQDVLGLAADALS